MSGYNIRIELETLKGLIDKFGSWSKLEFLGLIEQNKRLIKINQAMAVKRYRQKKAFRDLQSAYNELLRLKEKHSENHRSDEKDKGSTAEGIRLA